MKRIDKNLLSLDQIFYNELLNKLICLLFVFQYHNALVKGKKYNNFLFHNFPCFFMKEKLKNYNNFN